MAYKVEKNIPTLLKYGKVLLSQNPEIKAVRKDFEYPFEIDFTQPEKSNDEIKQFLQTLGITYEEAQNAVIVHKNIAKEGLKWHIDDCQVVKFKKGLTPTTNIERYYLLESIGDKLIYLYFNTPTKKLPKYTFLFYSSTYMQDFEGGLLTLADGTQIKPIKNKGIMLDSREAHMVSPVSKGIRNVSVVKIYQNYYKLLQTNTN